MESKKWYESLTIDATLVIALLSILKIFGVEVGGLMVEAENISDTITGLIPLVVAVIAIIGRARAWKKITG